LRFNALREYGPGDVEQRVAQLALARERKTYHFERRRPNGTVLDVRVRRSITASSLRPTDITERRRSEAKIAHGAGTP
jgi:hypothetical protein